MPNIEKVKNHEGKTIFPVTVADAVLMGGGQTLEGKLSELGSEVRTLEKEIKLKINLDSDDFEIGGLSLNSSGVIQYSSSTSFIRSKQGKTVHLPKCVINMIGCKIRAILSSGGVLSQIYDYPSKTSVAIDAEGDYYLAFNNISGSVENVSDVLGNIELITTDSLEARLNHVTEHANEIDEYQATGSEFSIDGYYISSANGKEYENSNFKITGFLPAIDNITIYGNSDAAPIACWYDENKVFISSEPFVESPTVITKPKNARYFRACVYKPFSNNPRVCANVQDMLSKDNIYQKKIVICKQGQDLLSDAKWTQGGYYLSDGRIYTDNTTMWYSNLVECGEGTFASNAKVAGDARIVWFDKYKNFIGCNTEDEPTSIVLPRNARYVGVSTRIAGMNPHPSLIPEADVVKDVVIHNIHKTYHNESNIATKINDSVIFLADELRCNTLRLHFTFKINRYVETGNTFRLATIGKLGIDLIGQNNDVLVSEEPSFGLTTKFPIPKRNVYFSEIYGNNRTITESRTLPNYNEIIGDDVLSIQYVGNRATYDNNIDNENVQNDLSSKSNTLRLSFVDGIINIKNGGTEYINEDVSSLTLSQLVIRLKEVLPSMFKVVQIGDSSTKVNEIANISEVYLVSQYHKYSIKGSDLRYDAFPCYFQKKIDNSIHSCEVVIDNGFATWMVDGMSKTSIGATEIESFTTMQICDGDMFSVVDWELNVGHIGDAEVVSGNTIVSKYNPSVVCLEGHAMWCGDETNGREPIYQDMTPTGNQVSIIPTEYKEVIGSISLANVAMSDKRFMKVCKLAELKGYKYVSMVEMKDLNSGLLPKRCWNISFDDKNQYFYNDLRIRKVFGKMGIRPTLSVSYNPESINDAELANLHKLIKNAGWEVVTHLYREPDMSAISSSCLYNTTDSDISNTSDTNVRKWNIQRLTSDNLFIDWSSLVYPSGAANANVVKALEYLGVSNAFMTNTGVRVCRATNKYYIRRVNASDHTMFYKVEDVFV